MKPVSATRASLDKRPAEVAAMFDGVARRYDITNTVLSMGQDRRWRGLVTAAIGSDGAGSVRIPAAWTHLVGIKPQRGRISTWPLREAFNGITVNGVLARTVADAALVLDAASGNVDGDRTTHRIQVQAGDWTNLLPGCELHVRRRQFGSLF